MWRSSSWGTASQLCKPWLQQALSVCTILHITQLCTLFPRLSVRLSHWSFSWVGAAWPHLIRFHFCRSCPDCVKQHAGCCCDECLRAPRLRPLLDEKQPYERWHNYRPEIPKPSHPPGYISRRALKRQRRKERRRESEINLQESKNGGVVMPKLVNSSVLQD